MDPYEIGFYVLLGLFGVIGVVVLVAFVLHKLKNANILGDIGLESSDYITTWFSLFPYVFFFAGPMIDAINSSVMYSKASLVGFFATVVTAFFGSERYASWSSSLLGFLPSIRQSLPDGTTSTNWIGILVWGLILLAGTVPMIVTGAMNTGFTLGWSVSVAFGSILFLTLLAGNDFLGNVVPTGDPITSPSTYGDVNVANVCATPGLSCVQTSFAPVGILLNTSILASHFFEAVDTGNTGTMTTLGIAMAVAFILEATTQVSKGCVSSYKYGWGSSVISLAIGLGSGASAYYTMKRTSQESFTSSSQDGGVFHPPAAPQKEVKSDSEKLSTKIVVGPQPETNAPVNDLDQFVCEAYKDGELVTSTIVD